MFRQLFSISRDGDSATSLGSLCHCLVTLTVQKFFLMFGWNLLLSYLFFFLHSPMVRTSASVTEKLSGLLLASQSRKKCSDNLPVVHLPQGRKMASPPVPHLGKAGEDMLWGNFIIMNCKIQTFLPLCCPCC